MRHSAPNRPPRAMVRPIGSGQGVNDPKPQSGPSPTSTCRSPVLAPPRARTSCVPTARVACRTATETDVCANAVTPPKFMSAISAASRRIIPRFLNSWRYVALTWATVRAADPGSRRSRSTPASSSTVAAQVRRYPGGPTRRRARCQAAPLAGRPHLLHPAGRTAHAPRGGGVDLRALGRRASAGQAITRAPGYPRSP